MKKKKIWIAERLGRDYSIIKREIMEVKMFYMKKMMFLLFFCDPYASWQKGGIENLNGLVREYLPKRSNLDTVKQEEILIIQEKLNDRTSKSLHYKTPNEIFNEMRFQNFQKGALNS
ncbi:MAG: IS30 family transposase [Candidatus Moranbacteria bacterium]|nr:IS30 family transposase [Candidatus Moranbacteria bacterium]